uniref:Putative ovule protein n=1 Tax=Solanum chacoense TaxID=4108 RepID=A0A0V0GSA8_SOLCH
MQKTHKKTTSTISKEVALNSSKDDGICGSITFDILLLFLQENLSYMHLHPDKNLTICTIYSHIYDGCYM